MANLSRRGFIKRASAGAATVGALATLPTITPGRVSAHAAAPEHISAEHSGPIVAHIRNAASGEVSIYVGNREVVVHDPELVAKLVKAVR